MNSTTQETNSHNGACCRLSSQLVPAGYLYQRSSGTGSKYTHKHQHTHTQTNRQEPIVHIGTTSLEVIDKRIYSLLLSLGFTPLANVYHEKS